MQRYILPIVFLLTVPFIYLYCEESGGEQLLDPDGAPIVLDSSHTGYSHTLCSDCHSLPVENHVSTESHLCAECHGGNGACNPNGANSSKQDHSADGTGCIDCHTEQHTYTTAESCIACHFASEGTVDCPE